MIKSPLCLIFAKIMGNIVWLASYPKSGNTWLRAFLANLIANLPDPVPLDRLPHYCEDEARPDIFSELSGRPSVEMELDEISILRPQVHAQIAARSNGTRFVKTHNMAGSFDHHPLQNFSVTAGVIHVVRNPMDVAISMTHHFGLSLDEAIERLGNVNVATQNDALFVSQILGSWSSHTKSWADLATPPSLTLRYEDLLQNPGKQFSKIARFVGLGNDRARIERAVRHSAFKNLSAMEKKDGFKEASDKSKRFFRNGRMSEWRDVLSRDQIGEIVERHREQMTRFKYLPPGF